MQSPDSAIASDTAPSGQPLDPSRYPAASQRLGVGHRVRRSADYQACYRRGRRRHGSLLTLHVLKRDDAPVARLGITASRKVGKAVVRNRLKRQVRDIFRRAPERSSLPPADYVVHLKPAAARSSFPQLQAELRSLLVREDRNHGTRRR